MSEENREQNNIQQEQNKRQDFFEEKQFVRQSVLIDFATLNKLILKDLNKTQSASTLLRRYDKEKLRTFLDNPERNQKQLRDISQFLYNASSHYKRLIKYFAQLLTLDYIVEPYDLALDTSKINIEAFKKSYKKTLDLLETMNLKHEFKKIFTVAFREDVFYGYEHIAKNSYFIQKLNPEYCQLSSIEDGVYNFAFDFSFFDRYKKQLDMYPEEFKTKYAIYQRDKTNFRWQELNSTNTICIKINEDIPYPIPPFIGVLESLLDIDDYKSLRKAKTEIENYKVLISKVPIRANSEQNDDFAMTPESITKFHNLAAQSLPDEVGLISTPMETTDISFEPDRVGNDNVLQATRDYWDSSGVSQLLFNKDGSASVGLSKSINTDEAFAFELLRQVERWINRKLKNFLGASNKFKVCMLEVTIFNQGDYFDRMLKGAQYGLPVKSRACAALGLSPSSIQSMTFLENEILNFTDNWIPLKSSHTDSSNGAGAPAKDEDELTDAGVTNRDQEGNENRE